MRCLVGFLCVLSLLISPLGTSAQANEETSPPPRTAKGHRAQTDEASEPDARPKFAFLLMPEHLRQRVPGHRNTASEAKFAIEYTQPLTPKEEEWQRHRRKRNVAIGVTASVIAIGVAVGVGMAVTAPMRNMEW